VITIHAPDPHTGVMTRHDVAYRQNLALRDYLADLRLIGVRMHCTPVNQSGEPVHMQQELHDDAVVTLLPTRRQT
jgi:hypothetical protein